MSSAGAAQQQFDMTVDAAGFIRMVWHRGVAISEPQARQAMAAANELCRETPLPILTDLATIGSVDRLAWPVSSGPSKPCRIALIGTSAVDRIMAGFMMGIHKPPNP